MQSTRRTSKDAPHMQIRLSCKAECSEAARSVRPYGAPRLQTDLARTYNLGITSHNLRRRKKCLMPTPSEALGRETAVRSLLPIHTRGFETPTIASDPARIRLHASV